MTERTEAEKIEEGKQIVRIVLMFIMVVFAYTETGPVTAVCCYL